MPVPSHVLVTTEVQRKQRAARMGVHPGPTPDLTFDPPVRINGRSISWMDAKMLYASYMLRHKKFMPENRLVQTAEKYSKLFGPGAFVFGNGYCLALEQEVPALLLDSTPLDMTVIDSVVEGGEMGKSMTAREMQSLFAVRRLL